MSTFRQTTIIAASLFKRVVRTPAATLPNLAISVFFLFIYDGLLGGSPQIEQLTGGHYLAFILPLPILTAAVGGSVAGQLLVEDVQSGYYTRLLTSTVRRPAIVAAPIVVGAIAVIVQVGVIVAIGLLRGVEPATGVAGVVALIGISLLFGISFAAYTVALALITRNAAAVQAASFVFFPFLFMAPAFLPRSQLRGWLEHVATYNPVTYILEGMRSLLIGGWDAPSVLRAVAAAAGLAVVASLWAVKVAARATARG